METLMSILDELKVLNRTDSEDEDAHLPISTLEAFDSLCGELKRRPNLRKSLVNETNHENNYSNLII